MPTGSLNAAPPHTELWVFAGQRLRQPCFSHSALSNLLPTSWLQETPYQVHVPQPREGFGVWLRASLWPALHWQSCREYLLWKRFSTLDMVTHGVLELWTQVHMCMAQLEIQCISSLYGSWNRGAQSSPWQPKQRTWPKGNSMDSSHSWTTNTWLKPWRNSGAEHTIHCILMHTEQNFLHVKFLALEWQENSKADCNTKPPSPHCVPFFFASAILGQTHIPILTVCSYK